MLTAPSSTAMAEPDGTTVRVAAVVCAFTERRWPQIQAAIASLQEQTLRPEVIALVVDHNPQLLALARERWEQRPSDLPDGDADAGPPILILANRHERGLSGGRNTAIAEINSPFVAFLDDDAVAAPDWLARLCRHLADPEVVAVGGRVRPRWQERPRWFPPEFDWVVGCTYRGVPEDLAEVRNPFGGAMVVRRDAVLDAGGYDVRLGRVGTRPVGCEETELCIRIRARNPRARFLFDPGAMIDHHVPTERASVGYFLRRCVGEGRSKAVVRSLADDPSALGTERAYLHRTLPRAVLLGLRDAVRGDPYGVGRAAAVVGGMLAAGLGYLGSRAAMVRGAPWPRER